MTTSEINNSLYRPLRDGTLYAPYIPASDCSSKLLGRGDTSFAITNMAATARKYQHHTKLLTLRFFSSYKSLYSLCSALHQFLFWHFQYAIDGDAQLLRSPACSWASRYSGIDCKSYTIFGSTVLLNLGIKHYMRRIVQPSHPDGYTHVYLVIPKNQKTANLNSGYYVIDGTINTEKELPYLKHDDILMSSSANQSVGKALSAPAQPTLTDVMNASYTASTQIAQLTHEQIVAQRTQVTNLVGTILASSAEITGIFFPPALIVGAAIEAVTAIVSLAFLTLSNPCGAAFYKADYINQHLKDEFYPQFSQRIQYLQKHLEQGSYPAAIPVLNLVLREVDLAYAQYHAEINRSHENECSKNAILAYQFFFNHIKTTVNQLYNNIRILLKMHGYRLNEKEVKGSSTSRIWYMIVPITGTKVTAPYRVLTLDSDAPKGVYPLNHPSPFAAWLNEQAAHIASLYGTDKAAAYRSEMQPFEAQIAAIRRDFSISTIIQLIREQRLQDQEHTIYQKYDTEYRRELQAEGAKQKETFARAIAAQAAELKRIARVNRADSLTHLKNVSKIAQDNANKKKKLAQEEQKKLLLLGTFVVAALYLIK